ncbi:MAG: acyl-CoA thioesterase [Treponema sp.]|nr:acyl-CoA thioesterase [Treponema sp.]
MEPYVHKVNYYETDKMGITHHSNYIRFMEEARVDFLDKIGYGFEKLEAQGVVSPVVAIECNYKHTTTFADKITIKVSVAKLTGIKFSIRYTMECNGEVAFTGLSSHCFLDLNGRPVIMEKKFPEFYNEMKKYLIEE